MTNRKYGIPPGAWRLKTPPPKMRLKPMRDMKVWRISQVGPSLNMRIFCMSTDQKMVRAIRR